jgi:hypothetical protein
MKPYNPFTKTALSKGFSGNEKDKDEITVKIAGRSAPNAMALYRNLKALGHLKKCHYAIKLEPYNPNGLLANNENILILSDQFSDDNVLWLLITQADWPLLQADTENTKIASFQSNRITGRQAGDLNLTILETGQAAILNSLTAIEGTIFNEDGTQNAPAEYAIKMTAYLFDPNDYKVSLFSKEYLVALQSFQIETSASDKEPLEVTTTWTQLGSFMRK